MAAVEASMGTRAISALALAGVMTASIAFAAATMPTTEADVCAAAPTLADAGQIELAAMFTANNADRDEHDLFSDAPLFIYATNEVARESDGVTLVDVSDVTSCASRKNII
jgi:hypothetical protein